MNALALQEVQTAVATCNPAPVRQKEPTKEELSLARAALNLPKNPKKVSDRLKVSVRAAIQSDIDWGDC